MMVVGADYINLRRKVGLRVNSRSESRPRGFLQINFHQSRHGPKSSCAQWGWGWPQTRAVLFELITVKIVQLQIQTQRCVENLGLLVFGLEAYRTNTNTSTDGTKKLSYKYTKKYTQIQIPKIVLPDTEAELLRRTLPISPDFGFVDRPRGCKQILL